MNEELKIKCPNCGSEISIDRAFDEQIKSKFSDEINKKISAEKEKIEKEVKIRASEHYSKEANKLKDELALKEKSLSEFREQELKLRQEKNRLEEYRKNIEVEFQRRIDTEKKEIEASVQKNFEQQKNLKVLEKEKIISDLKKQVEEMRRKADQGSQQTQGEVLEMELENALGANFPFDKILPVGKGVNGADVVQEICDRIGKKCGKIIWESKNTKSFSQGWISKLKEDMRKEKANIAVLVTTVLPDGISTFGMIQGIWITKFEYALGLATALRTSLIDISQAKLSTVNKNEKMEYLYNYLTGNEFKQRVEAIAEAFISLQDDLIKEKRVYEKIWAKREKLLGKVVQNTFGMYGDLQGLIGPTLPEIKQLQMDEESEIDLNPVVDIEENEAMPPTLKTLF